MLAVMPADLSRTFDQDAELYDRARPGYPRELVDALAEAAGIGPGSRVLEIGPGTGQATEALVGLGADVVAVEQGANLARVLRRKLPVRVVVSSFEGWRPGSAIFDAVTAFTAWHWLDAPARTARAAALLRPGGALATVTTTHVAGGSEDFFVDSQACYERWDPAAGKGFRLPKPGDVPPGLDEADDSPLFEPATRSRHQQEITYTARQFVEVLSSYSVYIAMAEENRNGLMHCIEELITTRHGGSITKSYLYELRIARRR